MIQRVR